MTQSLPTRLLTTRVRTAAALAVTALVLAIQILRWGHTNSGWLFTDGWHGWLPMALDVFFYGYFCWLAFWLVRGTQGPERVFMVGWFAGILLSPLETLRPQWAVAVKHIGTVGLAVALLAGLSLLLKPSDVADFSGRTDASSEIMLSDPQPRNTKERILYWFASIAGAAIALYWWWTKIKAK